MGARTRAPAPAPKPPPPSLFPAVATSPRTDPKNETPRRTPPATNVGHPSPSAWLRRPGDTSPTRPRGRGPWPSRNRRIPRGRVGLVGLLSPGRGGEGRGVSKFSSAFLFFLLATSASWRFNSLLRVRDSTRHPAIHLEPGELSDVRNK